MATLQELVNETTNIKDELVECHDTLKNNLIEKGIECGEEDKLAILVGKVSEINSFRIVNGDNCKVTDITASYNTGNSNGVTKDFYTHEGINLPYAKFIFLLGGQSIAVTATIKHMRNGLTISTKQTYANSSNKQSFSIELSDFRVGDNLTVMLSSNTLSGSIGFKATSLNCGLEFL